MRYHHILWYKAKDSLQIESRTNYYHIAIAINYEVAYSLSLNIFRFFILVHSKDQLQCHVHFYCIISLKWWQNGSTLLLLSNIKSHKGILILPWPILKVKVKVMHISIANMSKMVTDRSNITIDIKYVLHMGFRLE